MSKYWPLGDASDAQKKYGKLAGWLQKIMESPETEDGIDATSNPILELNLQRDYHLRFYQQLPDFIMSLLKNELQISTRYAPLLYHLAGCHLCHKEYLDLYDSLREALHPQEARPRLGQGTQTLSATPARMLGHFCQTLISQAEAILKQARREHENQDETARTLLQTALRVSTQIKQHSVRRQALQDLVRVATLFDGASAPQTEASGVHAYMPVAISASGRRVMRRADMLTPPGDLIQEEAVLQLQAHGLEGRVIQKEQELELHLEDLDESLRNKHIIVSVLLGALIEPVRWRGGNPRQIWSTVPVNAQGTVIVPLGQTDLNLRNIEERNLLEAIFSLVEVRGAS